MKDKSVVIELRPRTDEKGFSVKTNIQKLGDVNKALIKLISEISTEPKIRPVTEKPSSYHLVAVSREGKGYKTSTITLYDINVDNLRESIREAFPLDNE